MRVEGKDLNIPMPIYFLIIYSLLSKVSLKVCGIFTHRHHS